MHNFESITSTIIGSMIVLCVVGRQKIVSVLDGEEIENRTSLSNNCRHRYSKQT